MLNFIKKLFGMGEKPAEISSKWPFPTAASQPEAAPVVVEQAPVAAVEAAPAKPAKKARKAKAEKTEAKPKKPRKTKAKSE